MQFPIRILRTISIFAAASIVVSACSTSTADSPDTKTVRTTIDAATASSPQPSAADAGRADPSTPINSSPVADTSTATSSSAPLMKSSPTTSSTQDTTLSPTAAAGPTAKAEPAFGSDGLQPQQPITITVDDGTIASLKFTNPAGTSIKGELSKDKTTWTLAEPLGYNKTYTVTGTAVDATGARGPISGNFDTLDPAGTVRTTITPGDDAVVGVAAPVIVSFAVEPADREAVAKAVTVTTTPKVEGAWVWIQHDDQRWALDFRPAEYWPANTEVHVQADVYGLKFADGAYGAADVTSDFTIGRNQVVKADVNSHYLRVFRGGKQVSTYPGIVRQGRYSGHHHPLRHPRRQREVRRETHEQSQVRLHQPPGTVVGPTQRQRGIHPRQSLHPRRPGQQQRLPRLREPVQRRCEGVLRLGHLR